MQHVKGPLAETTIFDKYFFGERAIHTKTNKLFVVLVALLLNVVYNNSTIYGIECVIVLLVAYYEAGDHFVMELFDHLSQSPSQPCRGFRWFC